MLPYRCLVLDPAARVTGETVIMAPSDAEAVRMIRNEGRSVDCDIWQFTRRIALVRRDEIMAAARYVGCRGHVCGQRVVGGRNFDPDCEQLVHVAELIHGCRTCVRAGSGRR